MNIRDRVKRFDRVPASAIRPSPFNWRTHPREQADALKGLLAELGFAGAVLTRELPDEALEAIDGHLRLETMGDRLVPVLVTDLTQDEAKKLLVTFDPLGAMAGADTQRLEALLKDVRPNDDAVAALLNTLAHDNGLALGETEPGGGGDEFDASLSPDGPTRAQLDEVWLLGGKHRLLVGDCTMKTNIDRLLDGAELFMMVTDPPYGVEYDPGWRNEAAAKGHIAFAARRGGTVANDNRVDWSAAWKLFPGRVAYVWHAGRHASEVQQSLEAADFEVRSQIIWAKPNHVISRGHYHWQHEPCWYAVRKGATADWTGDRSQTTLWEIPLKDDVFDSDHGTQKPLECMAAPIRNHGKPGDVVYDPFLGSGTTIIAAHRLGRFCYGCELEPRYADVVLRRAEAEGLTCERVG